MDQNIIESGGFYFIHNFDSGNLGHVERIPTEHIAPSVNHKSNVTETPDYEFNLWTRPDCAGTEFENGNRTWFYFGVQGTEASVLVRLNIINLNKQGKMYNQGMAPVTRTLPGKPQWERIRDRPIHSTDDNTFTLSFKYRTSDNVKATTFFAFTYPYSFAELQIALNSIDLKMLPLPPPQSPDDIYYYRECLIYSLEGRRVDLLTLTSHHGITTEREDRLKSLFPDNQERPFKFDNKKVIFISARVHPGETPSSFVFNGFLNLLLTRHDPIAIQLRKSYVFKMVPFLNPDGVARGHYRTDTRGVNLNRVYLSPSLLYHPTVYAARALIRYYHFGHERDDDDTKSITSRSMANISESNEMIDERRKRMSGRSARAKGKVGSPQEETAAGGGEAAHLAEQVYDMKLHEMPSQTEESEWKSKEAKGEEPSLLDESVLRSCLGSGVHLTHSDELQGSLRGANPLRPLRDTLKNSITLLMDSSSLEGESTIGDKDSRMANLKMSWCEECRRFVDKVEEAMPSIDAVEPGRSTDTILSEKNVVYSSIDEYGEHQRKKSERQERKQQITTPKMLENVYFCTNCFKRYALSENNEEVKLRDGVSVLTPTSGGDSSEQTPVIAPRPEPPPVLHPEQRPVTQLPSISVKDELPKIDTNKSKPSKKKVAPVASKPKEPDSGLYLYIDLHGHASKKGIFMYGNYFEDLESSVECMLLPRIMALNNTHFHFSSCNFTERNMYLKDRRDGMSREGSGRVAVLKATGLVRSYTLECNYNTGRLVNVLPPPVRDATPLHPTAPHHASLAPPKYTPHIFEEIRHCRAKALEINEEIDPRQVGRSLGASILDLTGQHPNSRVPCSEHRTLASLRDWLRAHSRTARPQLTMSRLRPKTSSPTRVPLYARSKGKVIDERKENTYVGAKTDTERKRSPPLLGQRSGHDVVNMNVKYLKKSEPVKTPSRTRYLSENEPKPKTLTTKRRNILAIRKPNTSKTQLSGVVKAKMSRRSADDAESTRAPLATKPSKRSFARSLRSNARDVRCKAMASSSSDDMVNGNWEDIRGGTALGAPSRSDSLSMGAKRRPFPNPSPARLKKSRLKTGL